MDDTLKPKKWNLKDSKGQIYVSLSTQKIIDLIRSGQIEEEDLLSPENEESWLPVLSYSEFYETVMEVLEFGIKIKQGESSQEEGFSSKKLKEGSSQKSERKRGRAVLEAGNKTPSAPHKKEKQGPAQNIDTLSTKKKRQSLYAENESEIITLEEESDFQKKETFSNGLKIIFVAFVIVLVGGYVFFIDNKEGQEGVSGKIHLAYPRVKSNEKRSVAPLLKSSLQEFHKDSFEGYYKASTILVDILESNPKSLDAISLLCLTYRELWPYAFQDDQDQQSLIKLTQMSQSEDALGANGATCRAVQASLLSENHSLNAMLQPMLEKFPTNSIFYEMKSILLRSEGQIQSAIAYVQKTEQLWPQWIKPFYLEASMKEELGDFYGAAKVFKEVLQKNSSHSKSQVELGTLELTQFKNFKGVDLLLIGLKDSRLPGEVAVKGYKALTNYYISSQPNKALEFAKKAYALDPQNLALKDTIVRLGGEGALASVKAASPQFIAMGDAYFKSGDYFQAQASYQEVFKKDSKNSAIALRLAQCYWHLNQSNEAIQWAKRAIQIDPSVKEAYILLSDYYSQKYDFLSASNFLAKIETKQPTYQIFRAYALLEIRKKNAKSAISYAERALKLYDSDVESLNILSEAYLLQNQPEKAFQNAAKAIFLDSTNPKSQELYAESLLGMRGIVSAKEYLIKLINTFPSNVDYRESYAKILIKDEAYSEATKVLKEILGMNPKRLSSHLLLAKSYLALNMRDEALKSYLEVARIDPSNAEPLFELGKAYLEKKEDLPKALKNFKMTVEINPRFPLGYYYAGKAALEMGLVDEAIKYSEVEKKQNPSMADPYILLGEVYYKQKKYAEAATELRMASQIRPNDSNLFVSLARNYRLSGQYDIAASMLRTALSKESGNSEVYREQGALFEKQGLNDQAVSAYSRYLELKPNAEDRADVQSRIQVLGGG